MPDFNVTEFGMQFTGWLSENPVLVVTAIAAWLIAGWLWIVKKLDARDDQPYIRRELDAMRREVEVERQREHDARRAHQMARARLDAAARVGDRKGA